MIANGRDLTKIQKHMLNMFIALRWGVGLLGLALPVILASVGYLKYHIPLSGSMSAYYHATPECAGKVAQDGLNDPAHAPAACSVTGTGPLRNWFVGSLFFIGGAMLLMRGFSIYEDIALDIAGITGPCVALFPMSWVGHTGWNPHTFCAVTFFVCMGFTSIFCSEKTLKVMPDGPQKIFFQWWYRVLGVLMVGLPLLAHLALANFVARTFFVEAGGVWAFGLYWIFKTIELDHTGLEKKAFMGKTQVNRRSILEKPTETATA